MRVTPHRSRRSRPWRIALGLAACAAASIGLPGCPKDPTVVLTTVDVDQTVPLVTQLTLSLFSAADLSVHVSSSLVSLYPGSYDGGLPPILLPAQFPISVDPAYLSGAAIVRVDGVDNDTGKTLATGSTPAQVIPNEQTEATVTLTAVGHCGQDAGAGGADGGNLEATCDGGPRSDAAADAGGG